MSLEFYNPFNDYGLGETYYSDEDRKDFPGKFDRKNLEEAISSMCSLPDSQSLELSTYPFSDLLHNAWNRLNPSQDTPSAPDNLMKVLYDQGDILLGFWKGHLIRLLTELTDSQLPKNFDIKTNDDKLSFSILGEQSTTPRIKYEAILDQSDQQHKFSLGFFTKYQVPDWMSTVTMQSKAENEEYKLHFRGKFDLVYFAKRTQLEGENQWQGMQKTEFLQFPVS